MDALRCRWRDAEMQRWTAHFAVALVGCRRLRLSVGCARWPRAVTELKMTVVGSICGSVPASSAGMAYFRAARVYHVQYADSGHRILIATVSQAQYLVAQSLPRFVEAISTAFSVISSIKPRNGSQSDYELLLERFRWHDRLRRSNLIATRPDYA